MRVFISWSGDRSKAVAELLRDWISCVLQATRPWISTRDLDRGSLWLQEINEQLKDTTVGIICLTQENKERPWILFEAGALVKGLSSSRVCPLLIDLEPNDVKGPLAQFNHTLPNEADITRLIETINGQLGSLQLSQAVLQKVVATYWSQFEDGFQHALETNKPETQSAPRAADDMIGEVLELTRRMNRRINQLEPRRSLVSGISMRKNPPDEDPSGVATVVRTWTAQCNRLFEEDRSPDEVVANLVSAGCPQKFAESLVSKVHAELVAKIIDEL